MVFRVIAFIILSWVSIVQAAELKDRVYREKASNDHPDVVEFSYEDPPIPRYLPPAAASMVSDCTDYSFSINICLKGHKFDGPTRLAFEANRMEGESPYLVQNFKVEETGEEVFQWSRKVWATCVKTSDGRSLLKQIAYKTDIVPFPALLEHPLVNDFFISPVVSRDEILTNTAPIRDYERTAVATLAMPEPNDYCDPKFLDGFERRLSNLNAQLLLDRGTFKSAAQYPDHVIATYLSGSIRCEEDLGRVHDSPVLRSVDSSRNDSKLLSILLARESGCEELRAAAKGVDLIRATQKAVFQNPQVAGNFYGKLSICLFSGSDKGAHVQRMLEQTLFLSSDVPAQLKGEILSKWGELLYPFPPEGGRFKTEFEDGNTRGIVSELSKMYSNAGEDGDSLKHKIQDVIAHSELGKLQAGQEIMISYSLETHPDYPDTTNQIADFLQQFPDAASKFESNIPKLSLSDFSRTAETLTRRGYDDYRSSPNDQIVQTITRLKTLSAYSKDAERILNELKRIPNPPEYVQTLLK